MASTLSLHARALAFLAQREHSRLELARKLARHCDDEAQIETLLDDLQSKDLLSGQRFAESYIRRRASKFGRAKIAAELSQHNLAAELVADALEPLSKEQQLSQIETIWRKKFATKRASSFGASLEPSAAAHFDAFADVAMTEQERAKQTRFLLSRGFDPELVRQWMRRMAKRSGNDAKLAS